MPSVQRRMISRAVRFADRVPKVRVCPAQPNTCRLPSAWPGSGRSRAAGSRASLIGQPLGHNAAAMKNISSVSVLCVTLAEGGEFERVAWLAAKQPPLISPLEYLRKLSPKFHRCFGVLVFFRTGFFELHKRRVPGKKPAWGWVACPVSPVGAPPCYVVCDGDQRKK
jgi:hypothetical protein